MNNNIANVTDQDTARPVVGPMFFKNNDIITRQDEDLTVLEVCLAAESVSGNNTIRGAQRIRNLWRIYAMSAETRDKLLVEGVTIRGLYVDILSNNPYARNPNNPTTRVTVSNVPLAVDNENIRSKFISMGYKLTSKVYHDRCRDPEGKLTRFLTGRRYFYIEKPPQPCPQTIQFGLFAGRVYHREQTQYYREQPQPRERSEHGERNQSRNDAESIQQTMDGSYNDETIGLSDSQSIILTTYPNSGFRTSNPFSVLANDVDSDSLTEDTVGSSADETAIDNSDWEADDNRSDDSEAEITSITSIEVDTPMDTSTPEKQSNDNPEPIPSSRESSFRSTHSGRGRGRTRRDGTATGNKINRITNYMGGSTASSPAFDDASTNNDIGKKRLRVSPGQGGQKQKTKKANKKSENR